MAPSRQQKISWATLFIGHGPFLAANTALTSWLLSTTTLCLVLQRCLGWCHIIVRDRGSNGLKYSEVPGASGTITVLSAQFLAYDCGNAPLSADELISMTGLNTAWFFDTNLLTPWKVPSFLTRVIPSQRECQRSSVSIRCTLANSFLGITTLIAPLVFERRAHKIQHTINTYNGQLPHDVPDWSAANFQCAFWLICSSYLTKRC